MKNCVVTRGYQYAMWKNQKTTNKFQQDKKHNIYQVATSVYNCHTTEKRDEKKTSLLLATKLFHLTNKDKLPYCTTFVAVCSTCSRTVTIISPVNIRQILMHIPGTDCGGVSGHLGVSVLSRSRKVLSRDARLMLYPSSAASSVYSFTEHLCKDPLLWDSFLVSSAHQQNPTCKNVQLLSFNSMLTWSLVCLEIT